MSLDTLTRVIERASVDDAFRARLASDPAGALAGYDLSAEERAALLRGDRSQLQALGVDERTTKILGPILPLPPMDS